MKKCMLVILSLVYVLSACNPGPLKALSIAATVTATAAIVDTPAPTPVKIVPTSAPVATPIPFPTLQPGQPVVLSSLHMLSAEAGWGIEAGGYIVRTEDGGNSWKDVTPDPGVYDKGGFFALDASHAWVTAEQQCFSNSCPMGDATIWHTVDGGATWRGRRLCLGSDCGYDYFNQTEFYDPIAIQFLDEQTGWLLVVVGYHTFHENYRLYKTTDGGISWAVVSDNGSVQVCGVYGMIFLDEHNGWLADSCAAAMFGNSSVADLINGMEGAVAKTMDGGNSWDYLILPLSAPWLAELSPPVDQQGYADCGAHQIASIPPRSVMVQLTCVLQIESPQKFSYDYLSSDDGQTWHSWLASGSEYFVNASVGWRLFSPDANQPNMIQQSVDAGQSWIPLKKVDWQQAHFDFISEQEGWALVGIDDATALVHTIDGGRTWEEIKPVVVNP
jgi:photosystem II stability/assembly factor-like uncharacterized protein